MTYALRRAQKKGLAILAGYILFSWILPAVTYAVGIAN